MKTSHKLMAPSGAGLVILFVSACGAVPAGYANTYGGRKAAAEMCESVRTFTRASLDAAGLRRAWFLPFGSYEDGSFDFYAPMASSPSDDASAAFYRKKVGQLTHYTRAPEFAAVLAGCLTSRRGYVRLCQSQTERTFRASFTQTRNGRSIEILAINDTTSLLIADRTWEVDIEDALTFKSDIERTPNKSIQPTCEDARG